MSRGIRPLRQVSDSPARFAHPKRTLRLDGVRSDRALFQSSGTVGQRKRRRPESQPRNLGHHCNLRPESIIEMHLHQLVISVAHRGRGGTDHGIG